MTKIPIAAALASIAIAGAVAALVRFQIVEPEDMAHLCSAAAAPWWCTLRTAVIAAFGSPVLAIAAVAAGVLAIVTHRPGAAIAAACLGVAGLALYAVEAGAIGFLLGALALVRARDRPGRARGEQQA